MPRPSLGLVRTSVMVPPKHLEFLRKVAARRGTTTAELVRLALLDFVRAEALALKSLADKSDKHQPAR